MSEIWLAAVANEHIEALLAAGSAPVDRVKVGLWLTDAHQPLRGEDYALLAWVLERTFPRAVTLEYIRDRPQLEEQVSRLQRML